MNRIGEFILSHRLLLMILILGLTVLAFFQMKELKIEDDETTWFSQNDQTLAVYHEFKNNFSSTNFVVVAYKTDSIFTAPEMEYLGHLTDILAEVPYVTEALSLANIDDIVGTEEGLEVIALVPDTELTDEVVQNIRERIAMNPFYEGGLISADGRTAAILLSIGNTGKTKSPLGVVTEALNHDIRQILAAESRKTSRTFYLSGDLIKDGEIEIMMSLDMERFFPLSLLLTAVIIFVLFRSLVAVAISLLTVIIAMVWTLGLKGAFNSPITPVSTTLFALITIIGIANAIHLISHYRLEFAKTGDARKSILKSYGLAGKACLFTSLTTAIGFGSLVVSSIPGIRNLGFFAAFGIMSTFLLSIIIVPSGIMQFGIRSATRPKSSASTRPMLRSIANFNRRHPRSILLAGLVIVVFMAFGIPRIRVEGSMLEYLKKSTRLRIATDFIDQNLVGVSSTELVLYGEADDFKNPEFLHKIEHLQETVLADPKVAKAYAITDYIKLIYRALNNDEEAYYRIPDSREAVAQSLFLYEIAGGEEIEDYVSLNYDIARISIITRQMNGDERRQLIAGIQSYIDQNLSDLKVEITGLDDLINKVTDNIISTQIESFGLAFFVILIIMLVVFGLKAGLLSIIPNIFPIVFVFGFMGYCGFDLNMATAIIASIAIGMVVDDTIHYFSHFKDQYAEVGDCDLAMQRALENVGRALIFTSAALVLGFLIFLFSRTRILMDFGILSSIAILTALLGDLFIGPVLLMKIPVFRRKNRSQN